MVLSSMRRLGVTVAGGAVVISLMTGCGSAENEAPSDASSAGSAVTSLPSPAAADNSERSPQLPTSSTAQTGSEIGADQTVRTEGATARIRVIDSPELIDQQSLESRTIVFPVVVEVESGSLSVAPTKWRLITLSGKRIEGSSAASLSTALGDSKVDRRAEGLLPFTATSTQFADDVSISRIEFYAGINLTTPTAQWDAAEPIAISSLPRRSR
ncbi:hypothetical protein [Gordonia sp. NPDC058843]|uniref:hypothetical protein n=1 Tax=Gordonia sp. NPDC058843 TaxID=3346648 RepID=UPI0036BFE4B1